MTIIFLEFFEELPAVFQRRAAKIGSPVFPAKKNEEKHSKSMKYPDQSSVFSVQSRLKLRPIRSLRSLSSLNSLNGLFKDKSLGTHQITG